MGRMHFGWALALIDSAAGCAGYSLLPAGSGVTTIETKANFCRPIDGDGGRVQTEAHVVAHGRRIISAEASVLNRYGTVLAHGASTLLVLESV